MASSKYFWGIVTAAAAGAVIGLLFAPEEGNKVRKKLKKKTNSLASELIDVLEKSKSRAEDLKSKGETYGQNLKDSAVETAANVSDEISKI
jgi:gas vesicle protein